MAEKNSLIQAMKGTMVTIHHKIEKKEERIAKITQEFEDMIRAQEEVCADDGANEEEREKLKGLKIRKGEMLTKEQDELQKQLDEQEKIRAEFKQRVREMRVLHDRAEAQKA